MDKPGSKINLNHPTIKSYEASAPEQSGLEQEDGPSEPSHETDGRLQAALHSRKEQKRRLQIRTSCRHLCDLLPFVSGPLDTATTLELTAKYMSYLKQTLPPDTLSKVHKAVEENMKGSWKKTRKPSKKRPRRTVRLKRNISQRAKPAAKKSTKAHVSRRCTQHKSSEQVNQPSVTITNPLMMDQAPPPVEGLTAVHALPILLDKSSVPRGQMLPVCQDQFLAASFQSVENNWMNLSSAFPCPASTASTSPVISQTVLPEAGPDPSSSRVVTLEIWDATSGLENPAALPPVNFPDQTAVMNVIIAPVGQSQVHSPLAGLNENIPPVDVINQLLIPSLMFQGAIISSNATSERFGQLVSGAPCVSGPLQESSLCSSSPWTNSLQDTVSPFWLDLLLDTNDNLCFPDAAVENTVPSPYTKSKQF